MQINKILIFIIILCNVNKCTAEGSIKKNILGLLCLTTSTLEEKDADNGFIDIANINELSADKLRELSLEKKDELFTLPTQSEFELDKFDENTAKEMLEAIHRRDEVEKNTQTIGTDEETNNKLAKTFWGDLGRSQKITIDGKDKTKGIQEVKNLGNVQPLHEFNGDTAIYNAHQGNVGKSLGYFIPALRELGYNIKKENPDEQHHNFDTGKNKTCDYTYKAKAIDLFDNDVGHRETVFTYKNKFNYEKAKSVTTPTITMEEPKYVLYKHLLLNTKK